MEKITLKEALKQASVVDDLKNFVGLTKDDAVGLMTPERLAAVAGENVWIRNNPTISQNLDLSTKVPAGFYTINDIMRDVANSPINRHYSCILLSSGTHDLLISVDAPCIYSRFTEGNNLSWNKII